MKSEPALTSEVHDGVVERQGGPRRHGRQQGDAGADQERARAAHRSVQDVRDGVTRSHHLPQSKTSVAEFVPRLASPNIHYLL